MPQRVRVARNMVSEKCRPSIDRLSQLNTCIVTTAPRSCHGPLARAQHAPLYNHEADATGPALHPCDTLDVLRQYSRARRFVCRDCTLNPDRSMARCTVPEEPFGPHSADGDEGEIPFRYGMDSLFHVFQHLALRELCMVHCVCKVRRPHT